MSRPSIRVAVLTAAFLATACAKTTPAPVDLKGQNVYGRDNVVERSYASNNYNKLSPSANKPYQSVPVYNDTQSSSSPVVSQSTTQSAAVQSIGVSDLPPPSKTASKPQASNEPVTKPQVSNEPASVNKWTGKSRGEFQTASNDAKDKSVSQLDRVISNDGEKNHKPVKLVSAKQQASTGFMWPVNGKKIISGFGPKGGGKVNDGINIASADGEPVWAAADGEVVYVGNELQGYGNMVIIKHTGNKSTTYAHLKSANVDKYDRVKQGDIIGYVGSTGNVKSPQLHFALRDGKDPVDPRKYLSSTVASN